jgi:hypothetical protein
MGCVNGMGEWQKVLVNKLIEQVGLTHTDAMEVMGIVCDVRQKAYMQGYERGWVAAENQGKSTHSGSVVPCQHIWFPYRDKEPIEVCSICSNLRKARHQ